MNKFKLTIMLIILSTFFLVTFMIVASRDSQKHLESQIDIKFLANKITYGSLFVMSEGKFVFDNNLITQVSDLLSREDIYVYKISKDSYKIIPIEEKNFMIPNCKSKYNLLTNPPITYAQTLTPIDIEQRNLIGLDDSQFDDLVRPTYLIYKFKTENIELAHPIFYYSPYGSEVCDMSIKALGVYYSITEENILEKIELEISEDSIQNAVNLIPSRTFEVMTGIFFVSAIEDIKIESITISHKIVEHDNESYLIPVIKLLLVKEIYSKKFHAIGYVNFLKEAIK